MTRIIKKDLRPSNREQKGKGCKQMTNIEKSSALKNRSLPHRKNI